MAVRGPQAFSGGCLAEGSSTVSDTLPVSPAVWPLLHIPELWRCPPNFHHHQLKQDLDVLNSVRQRDWTTDRGFKFMNCSKFIKVQILTVNVFTISWWIIKHMASWLLLWLILQPCCPHSQSHLVIRLLWKCNRSESDSAVERRTLRL